MQRYFEIALYLMVCMGFATLALTGRLAAVAVVMVSLAVAFRGYLLLAVVIGWSVSIGLLF